MYRDARPPGNRIRRLDDVWSRHPIAQSLKLDSKYWSRLLSQLILFTLQKTTFSPRQCVQGNVNRAKVNDLDVLWDGRGKDVQCLVRN